MPDETPLTPIEQSRAATGRRHYRVDPATYSQLAAGVDQLRGYPRGVGTKAQTLRGLSLIANLQVANDGSGHVLVSLELWRFTTADDEMMAPAIEAGLVTELTQDEFNVLKPTPQEEP